MKRLVIALLFFVTIEGHCAEAPHQSWPEDFFSFYADFRSAVQKKDYKSVTLSTCFPFRVYNYSEGIPTNQRSQPISKSTFIKKRLAEYYLQKQGRIEIEENINGTPVDVLLYENYRQIIVENENPVVLKKLAPDASEYNSRTNQVLILELVFEKKGGRWCWAEGAYLARLSDVP